MLFSYTARNEQGDWILNGFNTDDIADFQEAIVPAVGGKRRVLIILMRHKRAAPTQKDKYAMMPAFHEIWQEDDIKRFYALPDHSTIERDIEFFIPSEDEGLEQSSTEPIVGNMEPSHLPEDVVPTNVYKMKTNNND